MQIVDNAPTEQLGAYTLSDTWFAWGEWVKEKQYINKLTPFMTCRESLIYFLYSKLLSCGADYVGAPISSEKIKNMSYENLVLLVRCKDKVGLATHMYNNIEGMGKSFPGVKFVSRTGITAINLPEHYYRFPFLTSYFCLIMRVAGIIKLMPLEELHKVASHLAIAEGQYLSQIPYEMMVMLINKLPLTNNEEYLAKVRKLSHEYGGTSSMASRLGANGFFKDLYGYKKYVLNSVKEIK